MGQIKTMIDKYGDRMSRFVASYPGLYCLILQVPYIWDGSGNSVAPELASGGGSGLYTVVVDARLSGNKRGNSVVTVPFLTASLLG